MTPRCSFAENIVLCFSVLVFDFEEGLNASKVIVWTTVVDF